MVTEATALGWEDLDGIDLESRRGRELRMCKEGAAWHVERAEWAVRVGVNRRAVVWRNDGGLLRTARRSGGRWSQKRVDDEL